MASDLTLSKTVVVALVVCFHPDEELLLALVRQLAPQVSKLWIMNNGEISGNLEDMLLNCPNLRIHTFDSNV